MEKRARALTSYVETLNQRMKIIDLNIGRGRIAKTFLGVVTYGVYGRENLSDVLALIRLGELVNVRKSRGIEFGHIKLLNMKVVG